MVVFKKLKKKMVLYKLFQTDIWGLYSSEMRNNTVGRYLMALFKAKYKPVNTWKKRYIYRIDLKPVAKLIYKRNFWYLTLKRVKLYYWFLSERQFRKLDSKARSKHGFNLAHFIFYIECRASVLVYRLLLTKNIFQVREFLTQQLLSINKLPVTQPNFVVRFGDIIQLTDRHMANCIRLFIIYPGFVTGRAYTKQPKYVYFNYSLMYGYIDKPPTLNNLTFPKNILDMHKVQGALTPWPPTQSRAHIRLHYKMHKRPVEPSYAIDIYRVADLQ